MDQYTICSWCHESLVSLTCVAGKPKQKAMGKAVKTPSLTWMEALPPPPPMGELEQCVGDEQPLEDMDIGYVPQISSCTVRDLELSIPSSLTWDCRQYGLFV